MTGQAWIIANGNQDKFRTWGQSGPEWTRDRNAALQFARRDDAEKFCADDEDAWHILPVEPSSQPGNDICMNGRLFLRELAETMGVIGITQEPGAVIPISEVMPKMLARAREDRERWHAAGQHTDTTSAMREALEIARETIVRPHLFDKDSLRIVRDQIEAALTAQADTHATTDDELRKILVECCRDQGFNYVADTMEEPGDAMQWTSVALAAMRRVAHSPTLPRVDEKEMP